MAKKVTKNEIVRNISEKVNVPQQKVREIVQLAFDSITDALVRDGAIELRNFGVFKVHKLKSREAVNPQTRDVIWVEERHRVSFKPGKSMTSQIETARKSSARPSEHGDGKRAVKRKRGGKP